MSRVGVTGGEIASGWRGLASPVEKGGWELGLGGGVRVGKVRGRGERAWYEQEVGGICSNECIRTGGDIPGRDGF